MAVALGALLAVAGCETGGQSPAGAGASAEAGAATGFFGATKAAEARDVESPDVFSFAGKGLWDGRPSLGGVWVAHSSVKDPERVIIRNTVSGKSVVGALFRRERENPGPSLQVSSDAADALGLLAGQPTEMSVIALRHEEIPVAEPAPEPVPSADAVNASGAAVAAPAPETASNAASNTASNTAALAQKAPPANPNRPELAADALAVEKPARKGLFGFLKKKPKAQQTDTVAAPVSSEVSTGEIEQKPLDPLVATVTTGIENAETGGVTEPVVGAAQSEAAPTPKSTLSKAYVQIGIFSTEVNAQFAVDQMNAEGMVATVKPGEKDGKPYWRVIVGPVATAAERSALIARIKQSGYRDAFPVKQ